MIRIGRVFFFCLALLALSTAAQAAPSDPGAAPQAKKIVFVTPEKDAYHPFWSEFQNAMQAATQSLGYRFEVLYANNDHFQWLNAIKSAATSKDKPAAIVTLVMKGHGKEALDILEETKVQGFLVNAGLSEEQYKEFGAPRTKYKYWLGEMIPDDKGAGRKLAAALYAEAVKRGMAAPNGKIDGVGVAANSSEWASFERETGLNAFISDEPNLNILQILKAKWERPTAKKMMAHVLNRYEAVRIVWSASDAMALGAAEAITEKGFRPGRDVLLGGVDWSTEGFDAIKNGTMTVSVGGHVMEGAWAVIMIFDYLNGIDFAESEGLRMQSPMYVADINNVDLIRSKINAENWKKIDYKKFSKFHNPEIKKYDFTLFEAEKLQK